MEGAGGGRVGAGEGRVGTGGGGDSPDVEHYGGTTWCCTWGLGQSRWYLVLHTPPMVHPPPQKVLNNIDVFWRHNRLNWQFGILVRLKFQP